jgi:hypothetical protein
MSIAEENFKPNFHTLFKQDLIMFDIFTCRFLKHYVFFPMTSLGKVIEKSFEGKDVIMS